MPTFIHNIEASVPEHKYRQNELRDRMKEIVQGGEKERRLLHHIYHRSGIETRHSVVDDFRDNGSFKLFFNGQGASPGTKNRNELFIEKGGELFVNVAQKLIHNSAIQPAEITHLITISCTGFYAPGPDFDIIHALNLSRDIERYNLGFMGCYAVIPALKLARQICNADSNATIMIVSVELCTLHFQAAPVVDDLVSASVFADGGAGAIVSNKKPESDHYFEINSFASAITDKGKEDMAWTIGDHGFNMILSSYVPSILSEGITPFLRPILEKYNLTIDQIDLWGIHPGGRAILDSLEKKLELPTDALRASRSVLSDYGNMSSATILFVLKELLNRNLNHLAPQTTLALAFGPGLTIESAMLTKRGE